MATAYNSEYIDIETSYIRRTLSEVRAVLEDIVEGEYRLFHSDSMDQDTGLEEKTRLLYEKVKRAF